MTSIKQWRANRRNAARSTGPKALNGKMCSRQNGVMHGLTAETVIGVLEDPADYKAFESAIIADFSPQSTVDYELVAQLASLLWRLRRAVAIESGIMQIHGEILRERRHLSVSTETQSGWAKILPQTIQGASVVDEGIAVKNLEVARIFLRVTNLEYNLLERLGRYESVLSRRVMKTLEVLEASKSHAN
jgi:hypothetical protein